MAFTAVTKHLLLCDYGFGTPSFGRYHHGYFYGGLSQENNCHVVYYSQIFCLLDLLDLLIAAATRLLVKLKEEV